MHRGVRHGLCLFAPRSGAVLASRAFPSLQLVTHSMIDPIEAAASAKHVSRRRFIGAAGTITAAALAPSNLRAADRAGTDINGSMPPPSREGTKTSLQLLPDGRAIFRLFAPLARRVSIDGDYPIGNVRYPDGERVVIETDMAREADGFWSVIVGPMAPGLYCYHFMVDGRRTLDFDNLFIVRNSINYENVVRVPGPDLLDYELADVPHGALSTIWYPSPALGISRRFCVYTPPGYETDGRRYPVLYLLHGGSGDEEAWNALGRAGELLDNMIADKRIKPMIVVMPNCNEQLAAARNVMLGDRFPKSKKGGAAVDLTRFPQSLVENRDITDFPKSLATELIPYIDTQYRTAKGKQNRAIAGLSVGAAQTLFAAFNNPELFSFVGAFSGGYNSLPGAARFIAPPPYADRLRATNFRKSFDVDRFLALHPRLDAQINAQFRLLYIAIGQDDGLITSHVALKGLLDKQGVRYSAIEKAGYSHEWSFWRSSLRDFLPKLFTGA